MERETALTLFQNYELKTKLIYSFMLFHFIFLIIIFFISALATRSFGQANKTKMKNHRTIKMKKRSVN